MTVYPLINYLFWQDEFDEEDEMNMYRVQGTLREWVTRDEVRRFIAKKFKEFLLTYVHPKNDKGEFEYVRLINEMVLGMSASHSLVGMKQGLCFSDRYLFFPQLTSVAWK
jgi:hypothetical protein